MVILRGGTFFMREVSLEPVPILEKLSQSRPDSSLGLSEFLYESLDNLSNGSHRPRRQAEAPGRDM
jgi:hypothetical protein